MRMNWEAALTSRVENPTHPAFELKAYGPTPGDFRIGLAPIPLAQWLEGGQGDPAPRKDALFAAHRSLVWGEAPGSRPGQAEALTLIADWLAIDRPTLESRPPLRTAARLVEDDLCLMEKRDGHWTLVAASLCSASFFTASEVVGKALQQLHGPVPQFKDRFLARVTRIFDRLAPDTILERRNWSVVNSGELSLPDAAPVRARIADLKVETALRALHLRSERQTIRRLHRTGGVLFTIRIWREPLAAILSDSLRRAAFSEAWAAAMGDPDGDLRSYKGFSLYDPLIRPWLDQP